MATEARLCQLESAYDDVSHAEWYRVKRPELGEDSLSSEILWTGARAFFFHELGAK